MHAFVKFTSKRLLPSLHFHEFSSVLEPRLGVAAWPQFNLQYTPRSTPPSWKNTGMGRHAAVDSPGSGALPQPATQLVASARMTRCRILTCTRDLRFISAFEGSQVV